MPTKSSMVHVRVDEELKDKAAEALAKVGLSVSEAVRILLTRVAHEGALPVGLTANADAYDKWFRAKVQEALDDGDDNTMSHREAMASLRSALPMRG